MIIGLPNRKTPDSSKFNRRRKVYDDLMARAGQGESLTEAEQLYLSRHEENLNKYGLAHDREGK